MLASGNENLSERLTTINANQIQLEDLVNQKLLRLLQMEFIQGK